MVERWLSVSARIETLVLIVMLAGGCDRQNSTPATVSVTIKDRTFSLEVAADDASRERGLAGRETIPPDGGMIFIFPRAQGQRFWMRDCLSDIDLIFLDGRGYITALHEMEAEPPQAPDESDAQYRARLQGYESNYAAQFAIELAPGTLEQLNLKFQDRIELDLDRLKDMAR